MKQLVTIMLYGIKVGIELDIDVDALANDLGTKAADNASCRSSVRHGCVKASIHPLDRAPLSAAKQARRTERLATRRLEPQS
jgi:hypothetical protein